VISIDFEICSSKEIKYNRIVTENLEEVFRKRRSTLFGMPSIDRQVLLTARNLDGCYVAGGAALGLYTGDIKGIKDWDLFFTDCNAHAAATSEFKHLGFEFKKTTDWSETYEKSEVVVQLITHRFCSGVRNIFDKFDFSVCCFAIDGPDIKYTEQAAEDVAAGQMNLIHTDNLVSCIKRIARYGLKGFKPSTEFAIDLIKMAHDVDLDNLDIDMSGCS
jgi:hypothetical protein